MNTHSFDVNVAIKFGVPVAIVLNHIAFWIQKNQANEKHLHDGRYWTYNSIKAFQTLFPYWSFKQMRAVVEKLKETGLVLTGNYNAKGYDQTQWYALSDEGLKLYNILPPVDNLVPICPKGQMDMPDKTNPFAQKGKPIPDIKPDIKPDTKSFCDRRSLKAQNEKKHDWATPKEPPRADVTKQSTSYKPPTNEDKITDQAVVDAAMMALPKNMRPKRLRQLQ